jgi:hypothetical protein
MPTWLSPWEYTSADWAGVQFLVLVAAAAVAWRQVREARRLREEQARPFVVIELDHRGTMAQFEIKNIGSTIARDVRFTFEPELASTWDGDPGRKPLRDTNLFTRGIPSLPPGKPVRALFDRLPSRIESGLPNDYEVSVAYSDPLGHRYEERMTVGFGHLLEVGIRRDKDLHDVHQQIERIAKELGKWTAFGGGLLSVSPDAQRRRSDESEEYHQAMHGTGWKRLYFRARVFLRELGRP